MKKKNLYTLNFSAVSKCHNETLCINILSGQKCLFSEMEGRKEKQVLTGGLVPLGGGKERVWEIEYDGNSMYSCRTWKTEPC
jgi:hypothetical protein